MGFMASDPGCWINGTGLYGLLADGGRLKAKKSMVQNYNSTVRPFRPSAVSLPPFLISLCPAP